MANEPLNSVIENSLFEERPDGTRVYQICVGKKSAKESRRLVSEFMKKVNEIYEEKGPSAQNLTVNP